MDTPSPLARALSHFGESQTALARAAGVSQPSIWKAIRAGRPSPFLALKIEAATQGAVKRHELRPDMWDAPSEVAA